VNITLAPTLVGQARDLARTAPGRAACTFVDYQGVPRSTTLTWGEVNERAQAVAAALRNRVLAGDRAAVLAPQGLDYVVAMLGAFYARVAAVPLFTPGLPGHGDRLARALADASPACALTAGAAAPAVAALLRGHSLPGEVISVDRVPAASWPEEETGEDQKKSASATLPV
jgi:acyl-CoA synthetase (AMP-forming)/AMP-acid ligase II